SFNRNRFRRRLGLRRFRRRSRSSSAYLRSSVNRTSMAGSMVGMFQSIQTIIGNVKQLVGLFSVRRISCDSMIHGHGNRELQRQKIFGENCLDAATQSQRLCGIRLRKQKREFVPADAKRKVRSAQRFAERGCRSTQHFVSAMMPVLVVHFLKAMQIENDQTQRRSVALRTIQFLLERFAEQTPIVKSSEGIGDRIELQLL